MAIKLMSEPVNVSISLLDCLVLASDSLPRFNKKVLAYLEGGKEHSGAMWNRHGYAFMVRHDPEETVFTVADGWASSFYDDALKDLDMDFAVVTHWVYLESPNEKN